MSQKIDHTEAIRNFNTICDQVISTNQPIEITRDGKESISLISTDELNSLIETAYLFSSHENAIRLLDALQRAKNRTNPPQISENLGKEFGVDDEEILSASRIEEQREVLKAGDTMLLTEKKKYIYWQDEDMWLGYWQEYPDHWTQGETEEDLQENLIDLYRDLSSGIIPNVRRVAELQVL